MVWPITQTRVVGSPHIKKAHHAPGRFIGITVIDLLHPLITPKLLLITVVVAIVIAVNGFVYKARSDFLPHFQLGNHLLRKG